MRRRSRAWLWMAWWLAGCATTPVDPASPPVPPSVRQVIEQVKADVAAQKVKLDDFTYVDLVRAGQIAQEPPVDQAGASCWPVLAQAYLVRISTQSIQPTGLASLFEKVRRIVHPQSAPDDTVAIACAALRDQTIADLVKFDAQIAALVASGGISGVSSLPGALSAAKKMLGLMHTLGVPLPSL